MIPHRATAPWDSGRLHQQTNRLAQQIAERIASEKREMSAFAGFLNDDGLIDLETLINSDALRVSSFPGDDGIHLEIMDCPDLHWKVRLDTADDFAKHVLYCVDQARGKV